MDLTAGNYKTIRQMVDEKMRQHVNAGKPTNVARMIALAVVGGALVPPVRGSDLEYWLAEQATPYDKSAFSRKKKGKAKVRGVLKRYKKWVDEHDEAARDIELAHWAGCSHSAFTWARRSLEKVGYQFEPIAGKRGFKVVSRPSLSADGGRLYTEQEMEAKLKEFADQMELKMTELMKRGNDGTD